MTPNDLERINVLRLGYGILEALVTGKCRITNLPADARVLSSSVHPAKGELSFKIWSSTFSVTIPGNHYPPFLPDIQAAPDAKTDEVDRPWFSSGQ